MRLQRPIQINYKGLGFVEALIAIAVSGIVSVVLMSISASAIRELMRLDVQDEMAQHAVSTAVHIQKLAIDEANNSDNVISNLFKYELGQNRCYTFELDGSFTVKGHGQLYWFPYEPMEIKDRSRYKDSVVEVGSDIFRIMCTTSGYPLDHDMWDAGESKIVVIVITGSLKMKGLVTNDRDIKDYEYFAVINL